MKFLSKLLKIFQKVLLVLITFIFSVMLSIYTVLYNIDVVIGYGYFIILLMNLMIFLFAEKLYIKTKYKLMPIILAIISTEFIYYTAVSLQAVNNYI